MNKLCHSQLRRPVFSCALSALALLAGCGGGGSPNSADAVETTRESILAVSPGADVGGHAARSVQTMFSDLASKFSAGVPAAAEIAPFFASDFLHDGHDGPDFIETVLRAVQPAMLGQIEYSYRGVSFDSVRVERVIDANTRVVSFRWIFPSGMSPEDDWMVVRRVDKKWQLVGDGRLARVRVGLLSRLLETPLTEAQVKALPGASSFEAAFEGPTYTYYTQTVADDQGNPISLWIGRRGTDYFGTMAWYGDDLGADQRLLRFKYASYLATPSSRVNNYIIFSVPVTRVAANVAEVKVTGPGLPASGLTLEPPVRRPRTAWVFKGDGYDWNAFKADRCIQIDNASNPVPNCGIDWSKIHKGSVYMFTLKDTQGQVLGQLSDALRAEPVDESVAYANRARLFPVLRVDAAHAFSIRNVFDDVDGPFLPGKPVQLEWTVPTQRGYRMASISLNFLTTTLDANGNRVSTEYTDFKALYTNHPAAPLPNRASLAPAHLVPPAWAWSTITAMDADGRIWDHELSPKNPIGRDDCLQPGRPEQEIGEHVVHDLQHGCHHVWLRGQQQAH